MDCNKIAFEQFKNLTFITYAWNMPLSAHEEHEKNKKFHTNKKRITFEHSFE